MYVRQAVACRARFLANFRLLGKTVDKNMANVFYLALPMFLRNIRQSGSAIMEHALTAVFHNTHVPGTSWR
jgi:hypothetical protein